MTREEALAAIRQALRVALKKDDIPVGENTDFVTEGILDSLDGMVFLLELSSLTGKEFPENDLVELGFFKVNKLVEFLTT